MCDCGQAVPKPSNSAADIMARQWQGLPGSSQANPDPFGIGAAINQSMRPPFVGGLSAPEGVVARAAIEARIQGLRNDADALQALLDALPAKLPPMADEALRQLTRNIVSF
jgi:hypothetical protein